MPARTNGDLKTDSRGEQAPKITKTTKLGMEIESDEDEDDAAGREDQKIVKNGSFSSNFLKSRNLFNLRLSTDFGSRLTFDNNSPLPKKSPVTPYSRQTSSSDSQKSANSLQPQTADWESTSPNSVLHRQRRNSISSCYSISEGTAAALEKFTMNQSELIKIKFMRGCRRRGRVYSEFCVPQITASQLSLGGSRYPSIMMRRRTRCSARFSGPVTCPRWTPRASQTLSAKSTS